MSDNLTNLRKIAEAVPTGHWEAKSGAVDSWHVWGAPMGMYAPFVATVASKAEAKHIATFDRAAVLALIDRAEAAEQDVARVREVLEHHTFVADDKYGDLAASQYYGNSELNAVSAESITRALDGEQG